MAIRSRAIPKASPTICVTVASRWRRRAIGTASYSRTPPPSPSITPPLTRSGTNCGRIMRAELLIKGGRIVDGTGSTPVVGDVLVRDGRIAGIGIVTPLPDAITIDAARMVVAPGFIDIHSHSDFTLMVDPRAVSAIAQGVTLEVIGNCGHGCA